jgi:hypothetical protein
MWERGMKVLVFDGIIDASGTKTNVEIGLIEDVGEYEMMISFEGRSWAAPKRIHKDCCMPIIRCYSVPKQVPIPDIGDLVMIDDWDYTTKERSKKIGTVHTLIFGHGEKAAEIMIDGELKKINIDKCFILQRPRKKVKKSSDISYINNVNNLKEQTNEKIEKSQTITSPKPVRTIPPSGPSEER